MLPSISSSFLRGAPFEWHPFFLLDYTGGISYFSNKHFTFNDASYKIRRIIFMADLSLSLTSSILIRIAFAVVCGALIGFEREVHGRPAGLRTHIFVCLGATILMILPEVCRDRFSEWALENGSWMDPGRIAAGIITGIGFLGAGTIMRMGDMVRGLTTASGIWFIAALGVMIGGGHLGLAGLGTILGLVILFIFDRAEAWISPSIYRCLKVTVQVRLWTDLEKAVKVLFDKYRIEVKERSYHYREEEDSIEVVFRVRTRHSENDKRIIRDLIGYEGIKAADWDRL